MCQQSYQQSRERCAVQSLTTVNQAQQLALSSIVCDADKGPKRDMADEKRDNAEKSRVLDWQHD